MAPLFGVDDTHILAPRRGFVGGGDDSNDNKYNISGKLTKRQIIGIAVGCSCLAVFLIAFIILILKKGWGVLGCSRYIGTKKSKKRAKEAEESKAGRAEREKMEEEMWLREKREEKFLEEGRRVRGEGWGKEVVDDRHNAGVQAGIVEPKEAKVR